MHGFVTIRGNAHTGSNADIHFIGDFTIQEGAADSHTMRSGTQTATLTDEALAEILMNANQIARGDYVIISG